ncbi:MAG: SAM-dependent methyltransferase, partial [Chthoniobacterales bacterium]
MRRLNRYFGSYRVVSHFLSRWIKQGDRLRVVDLATGSADIPRLVADRARKVGAQIEIVAVDFQATTIQT